MKISIIVPSCGRYQALARLLDALGKQNLKGIELEAVIALDGWKPIPRLLKAAENMPFPVRVLGLGRVGISAAKNEAIRAATGDLLLFMNDDVAPEPNFVQEHLAGGKDCKFRHMILGETAWAVPEQDTVVQALIRSTPMIFFYRGMTTRRLHDYRHAWNLNLSVSRELVEKVGLFSENLRPCMYEDLELAWRLKVKRCKVRYRPAARATHHHEYTWDSYLRREMMLGMMAHELWRANPDCFRDIYKASLAQVINQARVAIDVDSRDGARAYEALTEILTRPNEGELDDAFASALYLAHLPLKRRAFRYGLLKGQALEWQKRPSTATAAEVPDCLFERG